MTTLVLADDHHIVRQSLKALLEGKAGFTIVGEAENGIETVKIVGQLRPDVLVLDWTMPDLNSLEITRHVQKLSPSTGVVILSMYLDEAYVVASLRAGARAYVLKTAGSGELIQAVNEVIAGRLFLSSHFSEGSLQAYSQAARDAGMCGGNSLTSREREVLELSVRGLTSTNIAEQLKISKNTVLTHRTNLMQKLDLHNQTELVYYAIRQGILPPED